MAKKAWKIALLSPTRPTLNLQDIPAYCDHIYLPTIRTDHDFNHPVEILSDTKWNTLPHVILKSVDEWDPSVLDHVFDLGSDTWFDAFQQHEFDPNNNKSHNLLSYS